MNILTSKVRRVALLALAATVIGGISATAQPNGDHQDGTTPREVTAISTSGGPTLRSDDGGKTWRMVDPETARNIQNEVGRKLQGMATGNMTANTRISVDPYGSSATVEYVAAQTGDVVLTLHDARGVEVMRVPEYVDAVGTRKVTIDVTSLLAGSYFLRVINNAALVGGGKVVLTR